MPHERARILVELTTKQWQAIVRELVGRHRVHVIAKHLGVSRDSVERWARGEVKPSREARYRLAAIFPEAFEEVPAAKAKKTVPQPAAPPAPDDDVRAIAVDTLRQLRTALQQADPSSVPSIAQAIAAQSRILARVSGQLEITMAQLVRSAPWRQVKGVIDEVLRKHPAAAKDFADAFERLAMQ